MDRSAKDYCSHHICRDGMQPYIMDVLENKTAYQFIRNTPLYNASLSRHFLKRICSALLRFQAAQYDLLNKQLIMKLSDMAISKDYKAKHTDCHFSCFQNLSKTYPFLIVSSVQQNFFCECKKFINIIFCCTNLIFK